MSTASSTLGVAETSVYLVVVASAEVLCAVVFGTLSLFSVIDNCW